MSECDDIFQLWKKVVCVSSFDGLLFCLPVKCEHDFRDDFGSTVAAPAGATACAQLSSQFNGSMYVPLARRDTEKTLDERTSNLRGAKKNRFEEKQRKASEMASAAAASSAGS